MSEGRVLLRGGLALPALLAACQPLGPEARREAYLRCAQSQGVAVEGGTILSRGPADLVRLETCEALPR